MTIRNGVIEFEGISEDEFDEIFEETCARMMHVLRCEVCDCVLLDDDEKGVGVCDDCHAGSEGES